jgi:hypothetical protein
MSLIPFAPFNGEQSLRTNKASLIELAALTIAAMLTKLSAMLLPICPPEFLSLN